MSNPVIIATRLMKGVTYTVTLAVLCFTIAYPLIVGEIPLLWFLGVGVQAALYFLAFVRCEKIMVSLYNELTLLKVMKTADVVESLEKQGLIDAWNKGTKDD